MLGPSSRKPVTIYLPLHTEAGYEVYVAIIEQG